MYQREVLSEQRVLRILGFGFALVVLLVIAAAHVGYQGSKSIHENAQELVRGHFVSSGRGAELETLIEQQSQDLLDELEIVLGVCLLLAVGCAAVTIHTTRRAFHRLEWQAEELDRVSWQMLQDQEVVARRFSHELHDELGQSLTGLKSMLKRMDGPAFVDNRAECVEILDGSLTAVRELSQLLRPVILDDFGLDAGLRWLTERFSERTRIQAEYSSVCRRRLDEEQETHLFRIAQEALTNIARHSGATSASMRLDVTGDRVLLRVEDNGRGMPEELQTRPSLGLVGMRARSRRVGGVFTMKNRPGGGLCLQVEAPARYASAVPANDVAAD
jgi:signal transduction histidine kinase